MFDQNESSKEHVEPEKYSSGDILVEVEPERYELDIHDSSNDRRLKNRPKTTKKHEILTKDSLFRFDEGRDNEARLQKVLSYAYTKSEYYGQVLMTILIIYMLRIRIKFLIHRDKIFNQCY